MPIGFRSPKDLKVRKTAIKCHYSWVVFIGRIQKGTKEVQQNWGCPWKGNDALHRIRQRQGIQDP